MFAVQANASSNFGLYEKLYDDGNESVYGLIWSGYDPAIYDEPIRPGDVFVGSESECDQGGVSTTPCDDGINSLLNDDDIDTIVVVGRRPDPFVYGFQLSFDDGFGGNVLELYARNATNASLSDYLRVGSIVISADDLVKLSKISAGIYNNTILAALRDIHLFRTYGEHIVSAAGSAIPWQNARVNWNNYGANDPTVSDEQVLVNLYIHLSGQN